jgi:hypothetical protein
LAGGQTLLLGLDLVRQSNRQVPFIKKIKKIKIKHFLEN